MAYTANAGKATSEGVELQARVFVTDDFRIDVGGGYTKAELAENAPTLNASKGARLPGSPQVSANLSAQYDFEVAGLGAFVRADSFYVGEFYGNLQETPDYRVGDYIKVDARAGVTFGKLNLELFARNLTNDDALTWRSAIYRGASYQMRPRTIGVQLGYNFE
jgi:outer membrane receptor protein involved in Fe transport